MEKVIKNNDKIAYIVSSGSYHRKVYQNGSSYALKSYSETSIGYTASAFKTYSKATNTTVYKYTSSHGIVARYYTTASLAYYVSGTNVITNSSSKLLTTYGSTTAIYSANSLDTRNWQQSSSPTLTKSTFIGGGTTFTNLTSQFGAYKFGNSTTLQTTTSRQVIRNANAPLNAGIQLPYSLSSTTTFTSSNIGNPLANCYTTTNYSSKLDVAFYGNNNPDVAQAYSSITSSYGIHWARYGSSEHRVANSNAFFVCSRSEGLFTITTSGAPYEVYIPGPDAGDGSGYVTLMTTGRTYTTVYEHNNELTFQIYWQQSTRLLPYSTTSTITTISRTY